MKTDWRYEEEASEKEVVGLTRIVECREIVSGSRDSKFQDWLDNVPWRCLPNNHQCQGECARW